MGGMGNGCAAARVERRSELGFEGAPPHDTELVASDDISDHQDHLIPVGFKSAERVFLQGQGGARIAIGEHPTTSIAVELTDIGGRAIAGIGDLPVCDLQGLSKTPGFNVDGAAFESLDDRVIRTPLQAPGLAFLFDEARLALFYLHQSSVLRAQGTAEYQ